MDEKRSKRQPVEFEDKGRPRSLVQVCEVCGKEYSFDTQPPPADLKCDRCGNGVFRSFFEVATADEVEEDYRAATERDFSTDDPSTDVTAADVRDLNNI